MLVKSKYNNGEDSKSYSLKIPGGSDRRPRHLSAIAARRSSIATRSPFYGRIAASARCAESFLSSMKKT